MDIYKILQEFVGMFLSARAVGPLIYSLVFAFMGLLSDAILGKSHEGIFLLKLCTAMTIIALFCTLILFIRYRKL